MNKQTFVIGLITLLCIQVVSLWMIGLSSSDLSISFLMLFSRVTALVGFVLFSISFFLSLKTRFHDKLFSGIDRMYKIHQITGILAFLAIVSHPLFLLIDSISSRDRFIFYILPLNNPLAYRFGIISFYLFLLSFLFIFVIKNVSYQKWLSSHYILAPSYIVALFHIKTIGSDLTTNQMLAIVIYLYAGIGIFSLVYRFIQDIFVKQYVVKDIVRSNNILHVYASCKKGEKPLSYHAGQYVYVRFKKKGIPNEFHPFSVSSTVDEEKIRLSVKICGDYTLSLWNHVREGCQIDIRGPFGFFSSDLQPFEVWVAGGIGITPFISMLKEAKKQNIQVIFFYCFRDYNEALFSDEMMSYQSDRIRIVFWCSKEKGRLSLSSLSKNIVKKVDTVFRFCGPFGLMHAFEKELISYGVDKKRIRYENFSLKNW